MILGGGQRAGGLGRTQILALALATGMAAALLAYVALARGLASGRAVRMLPVVTAARDLPPRQVLSAPMLRVLPEPASAATAGTFATTADLVGKVTLTPILASQPVTASQVAMRSQLAGMAARIAPLRRAVGVPLDAAGGAVGFLEPGDHVDVLATFGADGGQSVARLIVSDARLLALGARNTSGADTGGPATSATLEVTPQAAQALALATARGRLTLALRGLGDDTDVPLADLSGDAVTGQASPARPIPQPTQAPAPAAAPVIRPDPAPIVPLPVSSPQITIVRGTQKTTVTVGE